MIVVENEGVEQAGSVRKRCRLIAGLFKGSWIVEPRQGNCGPTTPPGAARRRGFRAPKQVLRHRRRREAEPGWLDAFVIAAATAPAELFGGSVTPVFADASRAWLSAHPIFRSHYSVSGPVPMLYSSANYLIRREVLERLAASSSMRASTSPAARHGFLHPRQAAGFRFWWVQEAAQRETTPARRSEFDWIAARGLRNGAISAQIARRQNPGPAGRLRVLAKSLALLAAAARARGIALGLRTGSGLIGLYHAQVAWGRLEVRTSASPTSSIASLRRTRPRVDDAGRRRA